MRRAYFRDFVTPAKTLNYVNDGDSKGNQKREEPDARVDDETRTRARARRKRTVVAIVGAIDR